MGDWIRVKYEYRSIDETRGHVGPSRITNRPRNLRHHRRYEIVHSVRHDDVVVDAHDQRHRHHGPSDAWNREAPMTDLGTRPFVLCKLIWVLGKNKDMRDFGHPSAGGALLAFCQRHAVPDGQWTYSCELTEGQLHKVYWFPCQDQHHQVRDQKRPWKKKRRIYLFPSTSRYFVYIFLIEHYIDLPEI